MHPEIKQMWIDALRSGDFKKGYRQLCRNNQYCCLGVLCEITRQPRDEFGRDVYFNDLLDDLTIPFGKAVDIPKLIAIKLTSMNDGIGEPAKSFPQIADWIEENL